MWKVLALISFLLLSLVVFRTRLLDDLSGPVELASCFFGAIGIGCLALIAELFKTWLANASKMFKARAASSQPGPSSFAEVFGSTLSLLMISGVVLVALIAGLEQQGHHDTVVGGYALVATRVARVANALGSGNAATSAPQTAGNAPPGTPAPQQTAAALAAPTNLNAIGMGQSIVFTWMDNSTNETGFRLYDQSLSVAVADVPAHAGTGAMMQKLDGFLCNKSASYIVKAYNAQSESPASNAVTAVTIPCAPSNVSAVVASGSSIIVSLQNNATNETGYRVYHMSVLTDLGTFTAPAGQGIRTGTLAGLSCGTTYTFYVRAFNTAGESPNSNTSQVTTPNCTVTVTFTQIHVLFGGDSPSPDCGVSVLRLDCGAKGDVWLDFMVNGQAKRWPEVGSFEIINGDTKKIDGISYSFTIPRGQDLKISVNGMNKNSRTSDYPLGTVVKSHAGSENWGAGTHVEKPTCGNSGGCYELTYKIEIKP